MGIEILNNEIGDILLENVITIMSFKADWCMPCRNLTPILDELLTDNNGLRLVKINVDKNIELSKSYGVRSVPTTFIVKNGEILDKVIGIKTKDELQVIINNFI